MPYTRRGDEIGEIAKATDVFKDSIAEKVINMRVKTALDIIASNVMMVDEAYNIAYMNGSLKTMFRDAEGELSRALPQFDSNHLMGASLDMFHKDPAAERRMLDSLTGSHQSNMEIGSQKFFVVSTPVVDKHGKRIGTVVEWKNETV